MNPAFSARCNGHDSNGTPDVIHYETTITNEGGAWDGAEAFTVPVAGTYYFAIQFVKDAFHKHGTADDVYVNLQMKVGSVFSVPAFAWSGEGAGQRGTGAVSAALKLPKGALVRTTAGSDTGVTRYLALVMFSGFRVI